MSQVIEEKQSEKGHSVVGTVVGAGMAMMGASSLAMPGEQHADHGYAPARWAAVAISSIGWVIGGVAFPFAMWWLVILGGVLQVVALIVNLSMNAAGMGAKANDDWAAAKARAQEARATS